jgi:drug/metabolite transporter (DMT)-like permease
MVSLIYAPFAAVSLPQDILGAPSLEAWASVIILGAVCSALAFVIFFAVIREIGPARASLITYVNLAVAVVLGLVFLEEELTTGVFVGLPLVVAGSYLASQRRQAFVRKRLRKDQEIPDTL